MQTLSWSILIGSFSFLAGFVNASIALYLSFHWKNKGARGIMFLMIAGSIWSLAYGMGFLWPDQSVKLWLAKIEFSAAIWLNLLFLSFVLVFTESKYQLGKKGFALLSIIPLVSILLVYTNQFHHLMWRRFWLEQYEGIFVLNFLRGPGYWTSVVLANAIAVFAIIVLIRAFISATGILKTHYGAILIGISLPVFFSTLHVFEPGVFKLIDPTPASFMLSGLTFLWALLRYQMLNLIPLAHETIIESMTDPVIVLDKKDHILDINRAGQMIFKVQRTSPGVMVFEEVLPQLYEKVIRFRQPRPVEAEISFDSQAMLKYWILNVSPLLGRAARQAGWLIVLRDITARKTAQDALRESGRVHRMMLEASPNPIVFYAESGETTYVNPAFTRVFGWHLHELLGKKIDFVPEESREETQNAILKTLETPEGNFSFNSTRYTKSGEILDVNINATSYPTRGDNPGSIVVNFTDISQIKKVERELRNSQNYIKSIINSMPSILIGLDASGVITQWNNEACQLTNVQAYQAEGTKLENVFPQLTGHMSMVNQAIGNQEVKKHEKVAIKTEKRQMLADITIYPISSGTSRGAVIRIDDVSEKARLEEIMVQSEKMLSVGGLAAGMAHEINNPLAGILQNTQVIRERLTKNFPANIRAAQACGIDLENLKTYLKQRDVFSMMDMVNSSGRQAAQIVSNMLSFSRKSNQQKFSHHLHDIMEDTIEMVSSDYDMKRNYDFRTIEIIRRYQDELPPVLCEKNEIQQVFLNILKNGAQAMADAGVSSPMYILRSFQDEDYVNVEIEDNGPGIASKTKNRIFEPFFTTKDVGEGTGLGLSVSYFIITKNHGGVLSVESIEGKGTRFIIKIPLTGS